MAIRNIVKEGDSVLNKRCHPVIKYDERLFTLLDDMMETLHDAGGVGLAAPQVGILRRAVVIELDDYKLELINPEIIAAEGEQEEVEGCLSCPHQWGVTKRPQKVTVRAFDRNGKEFTVSGEGLLARAFCHELDHLDGILFKQKVLRMVSEEELQEQQ